MRDAIESAEPGGDCTLALSNKGGATLDIDHGACKGDSVLLMPEVVYTRDVKFD